MGVSTAVRLAEAGVTNIVVERGDPGCGSCGKPIGGVRARFSGPLTVEPGSRSLHTRPGFPHRPAPDIRLGAVGRLFLRDSRQ